MAAPYQQRDSGREQRRAELRRRLLDAVTKLTRSGESYADVSIERLATEAGLSRATFYTYFDGKADLLHAWFAATLEQLHRAVEPWLHNPSDPVQLRHAVEQVVTIFREHATLIAAMNDEAMQDSALREKIDQTIEQVTRAIQRQIELGQQAGWVDVSLLARETAAWLVWMLERGLHQIIPTTDEERVPALIDTLVTLINQTLRSDTTEIAG